MKQDNTSGMGRAGFVIAKEGYPFIFAPAFTTVVLVVLGLTLPALLFAALTLFVCFFFRDPDRTAPPDPDAIVSPADGRVIVAGERLKDPFDDKEMLKISIFMSIFNVHVNRIPFALLIFLFQRPQADRDQALIQNRSGRIEPPCVPSLPS
jgi:phosphatidylserine decarboxylase